ncbi:MAG: hydantoinase/oxoprolinase family protein [Alphaproteobacteria bacterium]|nr:MAG: hydantoinase/oxoprolinase family protein [Alphaproteobacteria bacterium]
MARYRVTVDTGGTFSDFVALNEETGKLSIAKLPSTPDNPSRAIIAGIEELIATAGESTEIGYFCHGTTVGTNALLEGKGAKTGLLVTEGFRGIYPVGEQARPYGAAIFDVMYDKPAPLIPQSLTGEVKERVDFRGNVVQALDEAALRKTVRQLTAENVGSVAVCLLFSFLYPAHEARVREIVREEIPECDVSLSCEVLPQIREYYRLSTTVINAYLQPILSHYIAELDRRLERVGVATRQKYIMQSNGGMATFAAAARRAVTTVLSGPAGGVTAGVLAGRMIGLANIITFDMGGTSCDVALVKDGGPLLSSRGQIAGRDLALPMLDINTVSAGGGTIATVDRFGMLQVGPASAGAVPGPACYGRGGEMPTITDCNLVLGYLGEDGFLGGRMHLQASKARAAIMSKVARPLGLDLIDAAEGIVRIIDVKMQEAIKAISTMRGHDLRDFMLFAFGGAGPLHAGRICDELGMAGVIVPLYPGVFSAIGLLMSDVKHGYIRSKLAPLTEVAPEEVNHIFDQMTAQALAELRGDGFAPDRIRVERALDMRYAGQGYEIAVPCPAEPLRPSDLKELRMGFDQRHQSAFGHMAPEEPVEIVSYRVRGLGLLPSIEMPKFSPTGAALEDARRGSRRVRFDGAELDCPIYRRDQIDVGTNFAGPAILEQLDCTTVVRPGQIVRVDEWKNLIVTQDR